MSEITFKNEWEFQRAVEAEAKSHGWSPFHIPDRAYAYKEAPIPRGFPDLILRYRDKNGRRTMIAAELKTDDGGLSNEQKEFLEDFAHQVPTFVWRPKDWNSIEKILRDGPPDKTGQIIEPSSKVVRSTPWLPPRPTLTAIVCELVRDIGDLSSRELAELRRMAPDTPDATAFWRLLPRYDNRTFDRKWALIMHGIALMTGTADRRSAHNKTRIGRALFLGGETKRTTAFYSETRLNRLLTARGPMLYVLLARLFRMLASANQVFDWHEMAYFILNDGYNEEQAEEARRRIARAYYQAERLSSQPSTN